MNEHINRALSQLKTAHRALADALGHMILSDTAYTKEYAFLERKYKALSRLIKKVEKFNKKFNT